MFSDFTWQHWAVILVMTGVMMSCGTAPVVAAEVNDSQYIVTKDWGNDLTIVEFTPKARPDYVCVALKTGYAGGISCFPKKDKKDKK